QLVPGILDVGRQVLPRLSLLLGRTDVVVDVVEVDPADIAAPARQRPRQKVIERPMAELAHPLRLVLMLRDRLDELMREPTTRLEEIRLGLIRVREAVLAQVIRPDPLNNLSLCLRHQTVTFSHLDSARPLKNAASTGENRRQFTST